MSLDKGTPSNTLHARGGNGEALYVGRPHQAITIYQANITIYQAKDLPSGGPPALTEGTTHVNVNQSHVYRPDPARVGADSATASTCTATKKDKEKVH